MPDKLARAQHTRPDKSTPERFLGAPSNGAGAVQRTSKHANNSSARHASTRARITDPGSTSELFVGGRHAGLDRTAIAAAVAQHIVPKPQPVSDRASAKDLLRAAPPGETSEIVIGGLHAGQDLTTPVRDPFEPQTPDPRDIGRHARAESAPDPTVAAKIPFGGRHGKLEKATIAPTKQENEPHNSAASVGSSAALISVCSIASRITGFVRTWTMAFALGATLLSSSYQVANNLPYQLYELVVGGMIVTAFLPVYLSVKKRLGERAGNEYASNLLTIVAVLLVIVTALCMLYPSQIVYTQSFMSDQAEMSTSVFFFQFFAIQIVFYGISAIVSGLLNANRDYAWSSIAPVANNVIVIVTFLLFAAIAPQNQQVALYIIAIGNPLGAFVQLAIQLPALKRNGIRIRPRINLHDPALRETLGIGVPAVFVMATSFAVVSVQNAAALAFTDAGPSVLLYARLWFTLPYAFLAVPITTAMFTELADMHAAGNIEGVKRGITGGTDQLLFFMVPFALYLAVFAAPLVTMYRAGAFSAESVSVIASYLTVLAIALPLYGINTYLQKIFSSLRKMGVFAAFNLVAACVQIALTLGASNAVNAGFTIETIALAEVAFYLVADVCLFAYLRTSLGPLGLKRTANAFLTALVLGIEGAAAGGGVLLALQALFGVLSGSIIQAFVYVVVSGLIALIVTFGIALKLRVPEAASIDTLIHKVRGKLARK